jgi:hypothetical protein
MENTRAGTQVQSLEFLSEILCVLSSVALLVLACIHRLYIDNPSVYKDRRFVLIIAIMMIAVMLCALLQSVLTLTFFISNRYSRAAVGSITIFLLIVLVIAACLIDSPTLLFAS